MDVTAHITNSPLQRNESQVNSVISILNASIVSNTISSDSVIVSNTISSDSVYLSLQIYLVAVRTSVSDKPRHIIIALRCDYTDR